MRIHRRSMTSILPIIALVMRFLPGGVAEFSYLVVAAYALAGRSQAIHALALSWLFSMLSPGLVPITTADSLGRYVILTAATLSVVLRGGMQNGSLVTKPVLATAVLGAFLVLHSLVFSPIPDVSLLKAVSWTVATCTLLSAWGGLSFEGRQRTADGIFLALGVVMVASLPLLALPLGYLRNGSGFQGVFGQPQSFGLAMAILASWAVAKMLGAKDPKWAHAVLAIVAAILITMSGARTAGVALVLGVILASVGSAIAQRRKVRVALPGLRSRRVHFVLFVGIAASLLAAPMLANRMTDYMVKDDGSETLMDVYALSRGGQIREMWENVEDAWLTGIGFGIGSMPAEMVVIRDPILNLPISASIEKGVMPIAVLEEVGVIGFFLVFGWIWIMVRRSAQSGIAPFAVLLTLLFLNLGESTLFSPGGFGLIGLILLAWAATDGSFVRRHA